MPKRIFLLLVALMLGSISDSAAAPAKQSREAQEVKKLLASIKGKEKLPAGEVFQNVQLLPNVPAGRFLKIMEEGYSKALGVSCDHCHVEGSWERDEKRPKEATREMIELVTAINGQLKKMTYLDSDTPTVNCTTCHRGSIHPAMQGD